MPDEISHLWIESNAEATDFRGKENWYKWWIYLDSDDESLNRINKVIYHLHHSFPNNIVEKTNRENKFMLDKIGWGMFDVYVEIFYDCKEKPITDRHYISVFGQKKTPIILDKIIKS